MTYVSLEFFALVLTVLLLYYLVPLRFRWITLLVGSVYFYYIACGNGCFVVLITALFSYTVSICFNNEKINEKAKRILLICGIIIVCIPWIFTKNINFFKEKLLNGSSLNIIIPLGISYYTLMLIAYMVDVYKKKVEVEKNFFKYLLFVIFFPHIVQGPIPKYEKLSKQLYSGNKFCEDDFMKGIVTIIFGFFLKLMLADKIAPVVNTVFSNYDMYRGVYTILGCFLFSVQLYTDFYACTSISKGVSLLFGIRLDDNFRQPFNSLTNKEFWGRWHMSLGAWLKEYIYIPLGGSRKGKVRKYINLLITFGISGFWHGTGLNYFIWGLVQSVYQIIGELTEKTRNKALRAFGVNENTTVYTILLRLVHIVIFSFTTGIFYKNSDAVGMMRCVKSMITANNFWILTDGSLYKLGLSEKGWFVFVLSLIILTFISKLREDDNDLASKISSLSIIIRWPLFLIIIFVIMTFGTYGSGFDANAFIYGGF